MSNESSTSSDVSTSPSDKIGESEVSQLVLDRDPSKQSTTTNTSSSTSSTKRSVVPPIDTPEEIIAFSSSTTTTTTTSIFTTGNGRVETIEQDLDSVVDTSEATDDSGG